MQTAPYSLCLALMLSLLSSGNSFAQSPTCGCESSSSSECASCQLERPCSSGCGLKHGSRCGCRSRKPYYEGLDRNFNCGCNGSFNHPVPPLYTYHWPGMYKQQRMTDYHSPWRFPAIKPYADEPYAGIGSSEINDPDFLQAASFEDSNTEDRITVRSRSGPAESMSSKFENLAR